MESAVLGADVDRLHAFATSCDEAATELAALARETDAALGTLDWHGMRATAFRQAWAEQHLAQLAAATDLLATAARQVRSEADEQERASAADGVAVGAGSGPASSSGAASGAGAPGAAGAAYVADLYRQWEQAWAPTGLMLTLAQQSGMVFDGPAGRLVDGIGALGLTVGIWRTGEALHEGDWATASWESVGVGSTLAAASQVAALRAAGGVGLAAQGGWTVGTVIYEHTGHTRPMIWVGDNIIGPSGDVVVGLWDADARARITERGDRLVDWVGGWFSGPSRGGGGGR